MRTQGHSVKVSIDCVEYQQEHWDTCWIQSIQNLPHKHQLMRISRIRMITVWKCLKAAREGRHTLPKIQTEEEERWWNPWWGKWWGFDRRLVVESTWWGRLWVLDAKGHWSCWSLCKSWGEKLVPHQSETRNRVKSWGKEANFQTPVRNSRFAGVKAWEEPWWHQGKNMKFREWGV